jgi:putative membrane protein
LVIYVEGPYVQVSVPANAFRKTGNQFRLERNGGDTVSLISTLLVGLLGLLHLTIMALEMFGKPESQAENFSMPLDFVKQPNAQIALKNQGIYNGALAVVMLLSLVLLHGIDQLITLRLLTGFVTVVGLYGGATVSKKIYFVQAIPGALTCLTLFF